jgi:hemoglobin
MKFGHISEPAIRRLTERFHAKACEDSALAPVFQRAIHGDGASHCAAMCRFWSSVLLDSGHYEGNPVATHLRLQGMEPQLFARWLELFGETCDELFEREIARSLRAKAARIAESLKLALFYRNGVGRGFMRDFQQSVKTTAVSAAKIDGSVEGDIHVVRCDRGQQ